MTKLGLFICAHDGISCHYAGAGTAASGYLKGIPVLKKILAKQGIKLSAYAITGKYSNSIYGFNEKLLRENKNICKSTGGDVLFCLNNSNGLFQYGDYSNWVPASASAATIIDSIIGTERFDRAIILGVDTPFAFTPVYVKKQLFDSRTIIQGVWVPHSTSLIHERGAFDAKRLAWEMGIVKEINHTKNMFVSYLNSYMRHHLRIEYGVNEKKLVPLLNGIYIPGVPYFTQEEIARTIREFNIPTDKPIIFSFGRGVAYKGFDVFLRALRYLEDLPVHFVLQVAFFSTKDPLLRKLRELSKPVKNISTIFKLSYEFPRKILQWKNTELAAVLSQNEPGAFIPAEIRIYQQAIALVSDRDGLPCQVNDGNDGFITPIDSPKEVADKIRSIFQLSHKRKQKIRKAGEQKIIREYDIVKNFVNGILNLLGKTS